MLNKVDIQNRHGEILSLPIFGEETKYPVRSITGLDPVDADFTTAGYAGVDGEKYQSSRRGKRNPIITVGLEPLLPSESVDSIRTDLYNFLITKSEIGMRFYKTDGSTFTAVGRVESFESDRFVKTPTASISILCFDPDFYDDEITTFNGLTTNSALESSITYEGTTPTGFVFEMTATRSISEVVLYTKPTVNQTLSMRYVAALQNGDILKISTVTDDKFATINRGGVEQNAMYGVSPYSVWPDLSPGLNKISVFVTGASIAYSVKYRSKFGGI